MATLPDVAGALHSKLAGTSAITDITSTRIYHRQAESGTTYPVVLFYSGAATVENTTPRISMDDVWRVESTTIQGNGSNENEQAAYALHQAVYTALHQQTLTIAGWSNFWMACERQQSLPPENTDGTQFWRFVWDVRIRISEE